MWNIGAERTEAALEIPDLLMSLYLGSYDAVHNSKISWDINCGTESKRNALVT